MSEYVVTARKWRPMLFQDVLGQSHVTTTLRNALGTGRLAHAYLFSGPRGVGKTTTARLLAKAVNCRGLTESNPDNSCENCLEITEGRSFDVLEIDGASNRGVEEIRNLREAVRYAPSKGKYRVYIIDEVHMLTKEAFNALLKTLEEPPAHALFIFATTEVHKVPPTILSRCQRFDFRRITVEEIKSNLRAIARAEHLAFDEDALGLIAKRGDGSLRDAQSIFDQVVSLCGSRVTSTQILEALHIVDQEVYFRVSDLIKAKKTSGALQLVDELMDRGYDLREFLSGMIEHFRNLLIAKETGSTDLIEASDVHRKRYAEDTAAFSVADLLRFQRFLGTTEAALRWSSQPRFKLEADLVQLVSMQRAPEVADLLESLEQLKKNFPENSVAWSTGRSPVRSQIHAAASSGSPTPGRPSSPQPHSDRQIGEEEIHARWNEFVNEVRRRRISLGSVLEAARLIGVHDGVIKLGCAEEFQASAITRNREPLGEIFVSVFHVRGKIQAVVDKESLPGSHRQTEAPKEEEEHPVIAAMKRELGAEPLEE